jgi:hypothetical protein
MRIVRWVSGIELSCGGKLLRSISLAALILAGPLATSALSQSFWPWGGWDNGRRPGYWEYRGRPEWRHNRGARRPSARDSAGSREDRYAPAKPPAGPLVAIVSLSNQRISVYDRDGLVARSAVSTGQPGYRTPTGVFSVIQKNRHHQSNIYSGAPMPWMHRITWSGIALHGGVVPGYPASHGCIRLTYDFAPRLWAMSKTGMRVIVARHEAAPVAISDPRLPVPAMTTAPAVTASGEAPARVELAADHAAQPKTLTDRSPLEVAGVGRTQNPLERARAAKAKAVADSATAQRALKPAVELAKRTAAEANAAAADVRRAEAAVAAAERKLEASARALENAKTEDAVQAAAKAREGAQEALEAARAAAAEAKAAEAKASDAAFAAATAAKRAHEAKDDATEAASTSAWALEPVSIFISGKEGRIRVRQGFNPLFEDAITIREPQRPLGTHVFTAMAAEDGGATLRWSVVTLTDVGSRHSTAAEALERIDMPKEVKDEVENRLWAGASLIISDLDLSNETGRGTDFIVLTKH